MVWKPDDIRASQLYPSPAVTYVLWKLVGDLLRLLLARLHAKSMYLLKKKIIGSYTEL